MDLRVTAPSEVYTRASEDVAVENSPHPHVRHKESIVRFC